MPALTLDITPETPLLDALDEPQVCYVLLTIAARGEGGAWPVSWALVADASRSMRIPIVDEGQFRDLVRSGGAQETLVDGVPVWQLTTPVPASVRETAHSALGHVARALHTVVERLEATDHFALVACAEEAVVLAPGASGAERAALAQGIRKLPGLDLGERTDLARGLALALAELRAGRDGRRAERIILLTDGFTERPEACMELAAAAAAERVPISTVGLGGEFQEALLTALADRSGGRALFLTRADEIPRAITAELAMARTLAAHGAALRIAPASGVALRRVTRIRPSLAVLQERGAPHEPAELALGDLQPGRAVQILVELVAPARPQPGAPLARVTLTAEGAPPAEAMIRAAAHLQRQPLE
ncbi:MAG TPA: VWA domain-containing protein, partial [Roseiflexaceae bacterium]|nr:VWA domain-containing protein [Roseiflexaceae bacterium]